MNTRSKLKTSSLVVLLIAAFAATSLVGLSWANAAAGWTLTVDGRSMKAYSDLKEYVWQKNASMAPNGQYDKIGLHRLVKIGITPKGVIFLCPGTYGSAEQLMSNPPGENWTKYENFSQPIYWANRGFDVYGIDYRTHFVPTSLNRSQLAFMADWGYDQWVNDIKEGVDKAKEVSGVQKLFMAGISFGGFVTQNYAAKYWLQDLRGIILLDGGNGTKNMNPTNTYNLTAMLNELNLNGTWGTEMGTPVVGSLFLNQYQMENPDGPAIFPTTGKPLNPLVNPVTNKTWANVTEWGKYNLATRLVTTANYTGGYTDYWVYTQYGATQDRYWPERLTLERRAYMQWINCPYVTYDYDDHYSEIGVPLLGFITQLYGLPNWGKITRGIASPDVTGIFLPYYGHMDAFVGVHCARDISQPALDWMRSQLVGLKATAFCDVTVLSGWTWWFSAHSTGGIGTHTYQWYEGATLLQGQTFMVLPVTKNTPGVYSYYCRVTDKDGTTTTSNAVTLTVRG